MPNWTTNYVHVSGTEEQISAFEKAMFVEDRFDFNGVLPMPEEIGNTVSPAQIVETQEEADKLNAAEPKTEYSSGDRYMSRAESARRVKEYGCNNWYAWANKNWGTKWNAGETYVDRLSDTEIRMSFDTAWCAPTSVFDAIEEKFGVELSAISLHEGGEDPTKYGDPDEHMWISTTVEWD